MNIMIKNLLRSDFDFSYFLRKLQIAGLNYISDKFLLKHLVIKTSDKKYKRRFDRSTFIFKLEFMSKFPHIYDF